MRKLASLATSAEP